MVAPTNGIDDLLRVAENGIRIGTHSEDIERGLHTFLSMSREDLLGMGACARDSARHYSIESFVNLWRQLYQAWPSEPSASAEATEMGVSGRRGTDSIKNAGPYARTPSERSALALGRAAEGDAVDCG
jgi:hypothetical protein